MHINLYSYNGEHEVAFKDSSLTLVASLEGSLRAGTSILNPTISLELPFADATSGVLAEGEDVLADSEDVIINDSAASSVLQFNYAYIPEFHRFYFVTDVQTQITGLYWVSMRVDVLMSHRQNFLSAYAMIERNEFAYNPLLEDNLLPLAFKKEVTEDKSLATGAYVNTIFKGVFTEGGNARNILINTITDYGVSYDVIDKPSYMDNQNFDPVNYSAMGSSAVYAITPSILSNIGYALLHDSSTRASFVKSIIAFPFTIPDSEIYDFVYIHVGASDDADSSMKDSSEQAIKGYITNYASVYRTIADFTIDNAQSFLDYAPYTHYELFIPFYGWKELDYQSVQGHRLVVYYAVNYDDGSATAFVYDVTAKRQVFATPCQLGTKLAITSSNAQELDAQRTANNANLAIGLISSALSVGVGAVTSNPVAAVGGVLSGVKTITGYMNSNAQMFDRASSSLSGSNAAFYGQLSCSLRVTRQYKTIGDLAKFAHQNGRPLRDIRMIGNLTGRTIVQDLHFPEGGCIDSEVNEIKREFAAGVIL